MNEKKLLLIIGITLSVAFLILFLLIPTVSSWTKEASSPFESIAVMLSGGSVEEDTTRKEKIKSSFSDEVEVIEDETGNSGIIRPVFKDGDGDDYLYVLTPIKK